MAIEVVERGELPAEQRYEGRCWRCQSLLRCNGSDFKSNGDPKGSTLVIACPVCNSWVERDGMMLVRPVTFVRGAKPPQGGSGTAPPARKP